jgi:hypothetical protein
MERAMTGRTDFTDDEWAALRRGLIAGEEAVRAAAPTGWFGRFKESRALKREWKTLAEHHGASPLAQTLLLEEDVDPTASVRVEEGQTDAFINERIAACAAAAAILAAKVEPGAAEIYVNAAIELAETAALADLGHGKQDSITRAESIVLNRVATAFGRKDYQAPGAGGEEVDASFAVQTSQTKNIVS